MYTKVTIYDFPDSQMCMGCKHGEFVQSDSFGSSNYLCLISSEKNCGLGCEYKE